MRNLQQGRLFSPLQTLYHLSSIPFLSLHPRWHDGTLFSRGRSYQAFYFGRTFKGNLGWPSMLFLYKINKSGWEKLADSLTAHRLETQSVHVRAKCTSNGWGMTNPVCFPTLYYQTSWPIMPQIKHPNNFGWRLILHSNRVQQTRSQRTVKLNPAANNVHQHHDVVRKQKNTADINNEKAGAFRAATPRKFWLDPRSK